MDESQRIVTKRSIERLLYPMLGRIELIEQWWHSRNKAFDMKTPDEVYQTGAEGREKVYRYVLNHCDYIGS